MVKRPVLSVYSLDIGWSQIYITFEQIGVRFSISGLRVDVVLAEYLYLRLMELIPFQVWLI